MYNCNAYICMYIYIFTMGFLHYFNIFRLTSLIDNYGAVMSVAMIYGFGISFLTYFYAVVTGTTHRMSGNVVYDFFMGASLNPRIGSVDLKMFAEVRVPWFMLFGLSVSGCVKQYDNYGYVTPVSQRTFCQYTS